MFSHFPVNSNKVCQNEVNSTEKIIAVNEFLKSVLVNKENSEIEKVGQELENVGQEFKNVRQEFATVGQEFEVDFEGILYE